MGWVIVLVLFYFVGNWIGFGPAVAVKEFLTGKYVTQSQLDRSKGKKCHQFGANCSCYGFSPDANDKRECAHCHHSISAHY